MTCSIADGVTTILSGVNQFVVAGMAEQLSAMKTAEFFAERSRRADPEAAIAILSREGGQPPEPEDRLPEDLRDS